MKEIFMDFKVFYTKISLFFNSIFHKLSKGSAYMSSWPNCLAPASLRYLEMRTMPAATLGSQRRLSIHVCGVHSTRPDRIPAHHRNSLLITTEAREMSPPAHWECVPYECREPSLPSTWQQFRSALRSFVVTYVNHKENSGACLLQDKSVFWVFRLPLIPSAIINCHLSTFLDTNLKTSRSQVTAP